MHCSKQDVDSRNCTTAGLVSPPAHSAILMDFRGSVVLCCRHRAALSAFYFSQREHRLVNTNQFLAESGCSYIKNIKETYNPDINQEKLSCSTANEALSTTAMEEN